MAATSDERREVAEKLRHASHTDANLDVTIAIAILDTIGEVHRPIAAVVADLIDPTCHIVCVDDTYNTPETGRVDEWHYECSKCGIELDDNDTDAMDSGAKPFDYCPNCGARITGGGDA